MSEEVQIRQVPWAQAMDLLRAVRANVFIEEQGISREEEWDGLDEHAVHFLATREGTPIGTARLLQSGQIGRMAVLQEYRRAGVGRMLLEAAVAAAATAGRSSVFLHAQRAVEHFYQGNGFVTHGDTFIEAGIAHVHMRRLLPVAYESPELPDAVSSRPVELIKGVGPDSTAEPLQGEAAFRDATLRCAALTQRHLRIRSVLLDPLLYDTDAFAALTSAVARRHAQTFVHLLISDPSILVNEGHRLLALARRLPSKVQIRRPKEAAAESRPDEPACLIADETGILVQPKSGTYAGFVDLQGGALARGRALDFDAAWERSLPIPDLRLLGI